MGIADVFSDKTLPLKQILKIKVDNQEIVIDDF
jgi:hypothetical protein